MKNKCFKLIVLLSCMLFLFGCSKNSNEKEQDSAAPKETETVEAENVVSKTAEQIDFIDDKYRTYYEIFLYSYCDSNGDGIGDINGLISKLDYLNDNDPTTDSDLGITGIWLMPIMPSPTYHKYDLTDYYDIDPQYGTVDDFKKLLEECHKRNINVIMDFVFNHTSSKHDWFIQATDYIKSLPAGSELSVEDCKYVDYYNFTKDPGTSKKYYKVGDSGWYYEGQFQSGMPDLNLDSDLVKKEIEDAASFWLDMGVDGFRIDAAKEFYTGNSEKNTNTLKWFSDFVENKDNTAYLVAEVWDTFGAIKTYYSSGIDSIFNYALGSATGKLVETVNCAGNGQAGKNMADNMVIIQDAFASVNDNYINASFITNHDNNRSANFMNNDETKTKYLGALNLMMDGTSFIYYGDEIGMSGSGKDENKRTAMIWSTTDTTGMAAGPKDAEEQVSSFASVEDQQKDENSIFNYYRQAINLRTNNPELTRGKNAVITEVTDGDICAVTRTYNDSTIILLINNSKETKTVTIDKNKYSYSKVNGYLSVDGSEVTVDGDTITLPAYGIAILK